MMEFRQLAAFQDMLTTIDKRQFDENQDDLPEVTDLMLHKGHIKHPESKFNADVREGDNKLP